jgi:hypothetical protein
MAPAGVLWKTTKAGASAFEIRQEDKAHPVLGSRRQLNEYFAGTRKEFTRRSISLVWISTKRCWKRC